MVQRRSLESLDGDCYCLKQVVSVGGSSNDKVVVCAAVLDSSRQPTLTLVSNTADDESICTTAVPFDWLLKTLRRIGCCRRREILQQKMMSALTETC